MKPEKFSSLIFFLPFITIASLQKLSLFAEQNCHCPPPTIQLNVSTSVGTPGIINGLLPTGPTSCRSKCSSKSSPSEQTTLSCNCKSNCQTTFVSIGKQLKTAFGFPLDGDDILSKVEVNPCNSDNAQCEININAYTTGGNRTTTLSLTGNCIQGMLHFCEVDVSRHIFFGRRVIIKASGTLCNSTKNM